MMVLLMRHGEAAPQREGEADRDRALTKNGKMQVRRTARILSRLLKDRPIRIFTSPFERTKQTARIVGETCFAEGIHTAEELLQSDWKLTAAHILREGEPLLFVSHHPFVQAYLSSMTDIYIPFGTADTAVVDYDVKSGRGRLMGYIGPLLWNLKKEES